MKAAWTIVVSAIAFMGAVAIWSRLVLDKQTAPTIDALVSALVHLFNGAFGK